MNEKELIEKLAELEHLAKELEHLAKELEDILELINKGQNHLASKKILGRLVRWKNNWKPYKKFKENI